MGRKKKLPVQEDLNAGIFMNSFRDKVEKVRSTTSGSQPPQYSVFTGIKFETFSKITTADTRELISSAPNKTCGLDPITTEMVKSFAEELAPFITLIFNRSLEDGYFPEDFKVAEITSVLKKANLDASKPENYRPISNLPFLSKLLERVVNGQLLQHLQDSHLLPENQSAYRKCHSTETCLLKVTSDALMAADQGKLTLLGLLDLSAAFDCVDHDILLDRLILSFGIASTVHCWICSYITGRYMRVKYNGSISELSPVFYGVPQGSVLGPLFFVMYTSDFFVLPLITISAYMAMLYG